MKKVRKIIVYLLFIMFVPLIDVKAATPYNITAEMYKFTMAGTTITEDDGIEFLDSYQNGDAEKITASTLNPGELLAVGIKYTAGNPANALQMQIGLQYDPTLVELLKEDDFIITAFDNRAEKNGGVFPGTGSAGTRVRWTISDANELDIENGLKRVNITLADETSNQTVLTNPGGIMFFYFFKVKDDATPKSEINFTFDDERNATSDPDGVSTSLTSIPVQYEVFGVESNDASLKTLTALGNGNTYTDENFVAGSSATSHNIIVPNGVSSIDLQATANDSGALISAADLGTKSLNVGDNPFTITVTAEDGTVVNHSINVKRISIDADISTLALSGITLDQSVNAATLNYTATVPYKITSTTVTATAVDTNATITGDGSWSLTTVGQNTRQVIIESESCKTEYDNITGNSCVSKTYTIKVTRSNPSSDKTLSDIKVNGTTIINFSPTTKTYTLDPVLNNVTSLNVTATTTDTNASAVVKNNTGFKLGNNTITITVTAEDGTTDNYTLNVYRQSNSTDITLSVTSNPNGTLTNNGNKTYTYEYDEAVTDITIGATKNDSTIANIEGLGVYSVATDNKATITVTAEDGTVATYVVNFTRKLSDDNTLKSLSVEKDGIPYTLTPGFSSGVDKYTLTVPHNVSEVLIKATANSSNNKGITGTGPVSLDYGTNTKTVTVTAEDNTTKTYTLTITRELNNDASLKNIKLDGTLIKDFASATETYTLDDVSSSTSSLNITAEATDPNAKSVVITGQNNLLEGKSNTVTIKVTAQDGTTVKTYTLTVYRKSSDTSLTGLTVTSNPNGTLVDNHDGTYTYKYDRDVTTIDVNATTVLTATIKGNGTYTIGVDTKAIITVTPEDGTAKDYTINFEQVLDTDNTLSSLTVSKDGIAYTLSPTFSSGQDKYTLSVPSDVDSVLVEAIANSVYNKGITGTGSISLNSGTNTVNVVVKAENNQEKTYTITITREVNTEASLESLEVDGVLVPGFNKSTTTYNLPDVENSKDSINITATGATGATVKGTGTKTLKEGDNKFEVEVTSQAGGTPVKYTINIRRKTTNAYLQNITVSDGTLNESFVKETLDYTINVGASVNTLTITGIKDEPKATLKIGEETLTENDSYTLNNLKTGNTIVKLEVTSEAGNKNTYTVTIIKDKNNDTTLSDIKVNGISIKGFASNQPSYTLDPIKGNIDSLTVTATATDPNAQSVVITGDDTLIGGQNNIITITVTAEDGTIGTYSLNIYKQSNDTGLTLDVTSTPNGTLISNADGTYTYQYDEKVTAIDVNAQATDPKAQKIEGLRTYVVGTDSSATVTITAEDGTTKDYIINFERQTSQDNTLSSLTVEHNGTIYPLNPTFKPNIDAYNVTVANDIDEVEIKAIASSTNNKGISGVGVTSLIVGQNVKTVTVTAENGVDKTYTITITRESATTTEKITSSVYNVSSSYVEQVKSELSITDFKNSLDNDNSKLVIYEKDGVTEFTGDYIGTGMIVKLIENNNILDEKVIIVTGDTTGDGLIDLLDAVRITNHYTGKTLLTGVYYIAGNVIAEDEIDLLDAVKVTNHYTGKALIG